MRALVAGARVEHAEGHAGNELGVAAGEAQAQRLDGVRHALLVRRPGPPSQLQHERRERQPLRVRQLLGLPVVQQAYSGTCSAHTMHALGMGLSASQQVCTDGFEDLTKELPTRNR